MSPAIFHNTKEHPQILLLPFPSSIYYASLKLM